MRKGIFEQNKIYNNNVTLNKSDFERNKDKKFIPIRKALTNNSNSNFSPINNLDNLQKDNTINYKSQDVISIVTYDEKIDSEIFRKYKEIYKQLKVQNNLEDESVSQISKESYNFINKNEISDLNFIFTNCFEDFLNIKQIDDFNSNQNLRNNYQPVNIIYDDEGNKTIRDEPNDINEFKTSPFFKIKNNCKIRSYEWELFPQEIAANQLKQGTGNCYMVSALEAMSHIPKLLNYIFDLDFSSHQDTYTLHFRQKEGNIENYIVKNNFPVNNDGDFEFIQPLEKEAYATIFEKVWALLRGGYNKLSGGFAYEVLNKVLGTSSSDLYNNNMGIFDININLYKDYMKELNLQQKYDNIAENVNEIKKCDKEMQRIIQNDNNLKKIDPKTAFDEIRKAQKEDGAIITTSISIKKEKDNNVIIGHEYAILGTHTKYNPILGKDQDFIIIKNPWRNGNDIMEKLDVIEIEKRIKYFQDIIEINRKHYVTGVFLCLKNILNYGSQLY